MAAGIKTTFLPVMAGRELEELIRLQNQLKVDTVLRRFAAECQLSRTGMAPAITEPWQVVGEQRMYALTVASALTGALPDKVKSNMDFERQEVRLWGCYMPW